MHGFGLAVGERLPEAAKTQRACRFWGVNLRKAEEQQAVL